MVVQCYTCYESLQAHDNGDDGGPLMAGQTLRYEEYKEERELFENYLERFECFVTTNAVPAFSC